MSFEQFKERYPAVRVDPLTYNAWNGAMPRSGEGPYREPQYRNQEPVVGATIIVAGEEIHLKHIEPKFFSVQWLQDITLNTLRKWESEEINIGKAGGESLKCLSK